MCYSRYVKTTFVLSKESHRGADVDDMFYTSMSIHLIVIVGFYGVGALYAKPLMLKLEVQIGGYM